MNPYPATSILYSECGTNRLLGGYNILTNLTYIEKTFNIP